MFVVTVELTVDRQRLDAFMAHLKDNAARSRSLEPGCHRFDICQSAEDPAQIFLYELYTDAASFDAHKSMPHYHVFTERTAPMVLRKTVKTLVLIEEGGA